MKEAINISTGQVKAGKTDNILVSNGIGSCIVVIAINLKKHIGAMAHIMLPGKAPLKKISVKQNIPKMQLINCFTCYK